MEYKIKIINNLESINLYVNTLNDSITAQLVVSEEEITFDTLLHYFEICPVDKPGMKYIYHVSGKLRDRTDYCIAVSGHNLILTTGTSGVDGTVIYGSERDDENKIQDKSVVTE